MTTRSEMTEVTSTQPDSTGHSHPIRTAERYYDGLAEHYAMVVPDWIGAVHRQGEVLDRLILAELGQPGTVLDCSCGVGTQALGLAARGHAVTATDASPEALSVAEAAARRDRLPITFRVADMRALPDDLGSFDVVLSCDNSLPHLTSQADVHQALGSMRRRVRPGGRLIVSTRDYDRHRIARPQVTAPERFTGPEDVEVVSFQTWDWVDDTRYHMRQFLLASRDGGREWELRSFDGAWFRAYLRADLYAIAVSEGFEEPRWLLPDVTGYHQPVLVATRP